MKKILIWIVLSLSLFSGCTSTDRTHIEETEKYIGYITLYDGVNLELDDFEFIIEKDEERIKELNLSEMDMPNGYYIYDISDNILKFKITDETEFTFFDSGNIFVSETDDKKYTTVNKDEFKEFLYLGGDKPRKTPFWVEVKNGKVISIKEEFVN